MKPTKYKKKKVVIYQGDALMLRDGEIEPQKYKVITPAYVSNYGWEPILKAIVNKELEITSDLANDIKLYFAVFGTDDFIGVAAEYKSEKATTILVWDEKDIIFQVDQRTTSKTDIINDEPRKETPGPVELKVTEQELRCKG
jgi:hypothetical protein